MEKALKKDELRREVGLGVAILFVIGSAIGSGIFTAPQNLAQSSTPVISIIAWIITALGSIMIAVSFSNMAAKIPETGGCVEYTRAAFGEFAAFLVAWTYWIGQSTGGAALITACLRYMSKIFPAIGSNNLLAFIVGCALFWALTYFNVKGIKQGMLVSTLTTLCKLLPLLIFVILAVFHFNPALFNTVSSASAKAYGKNQLSSLPIAIAITMWAFAGMEGATTAGGEIKDPERNIKRATIFGTLGLVAIYVLVSTLSAGILPQDALAQSNAPIADMLNVMTGGTWGGLFISFGVVISTLGCANGGIIMASRSAFAAAQDKLFPSIFGRVNPKYNTPAASIILSSIFSTILIGMNYFKSLNSAYEFIMLLATLTVLPPYAFVAAADIVVARKQGKKITVGSFIKSSLVPLIAFVYVLYAIYGTGADSVMWGFILMLAGIPFYLYIRLKTNSET